MKDFNALEVHHLIASPKLGATRQIQTLNALQVLKNPLPQLLAARHVQLLDTRQMRESRLCDGGLGASSHKQGMDSSEVGQGSVTQPARALAYI
jgi:hypothetical protein